MSMREVSHEDVYDLTEKLVGVYPPPLLVEYVVPEHVPRLGTCEELDHLELLLDKNAEFLDKLIADPALLEHFKHGLNKELKEEAGAPPVVAAPDSVTEADRIIEAALINRVEFAAHQMGRFIICEPYMHANTRKRRNLLCEAYNELDESMEFLKTWRSEATLDAYDDKLKTRNMAIRFGDLLGVDLVNDPWNEDGDAAQLHAEVEASPTTLEQHSSGGSDSLPAAESQSTLPEKKKPKY